ncbi:hypothetical protein [Microbispora bryophytorum]|uniref:STAS domain-containing protein n=1 Tax=Microbispora bryophytorum TaxID=1460882 RepID=A0A8H9LER5_9ACTN|nr:hypothetical protein [Microbispora bryophytorum]MBD3139659.1 hypothetical protein [Microbispora bryophytorum]GGO03168.1 hypothetical protein GCM10011574_12740 [Microbispora bryophytorum]
MVDTPTSAASLRVVSAWRSSASSSRAAACGWTGGWLILAGVAPRLARHLHVAGLLGRFEVCGTADEAVARVREPYGGERGEQG